MAETNRPHSPSSPAPLSPGDLPRLTGVHVTLEPLSVAHVEGLKSAVSDGELWKLWYTNVVKPSEMRQEVERRLALHEAGSMMPFTVVRNDSPTSGTIVGMTTLMVIDRANRTVQIGSTWYSACAQGTHVNAESKLLLLRHSFEIMGMQRVEFHTHSMNRHSRAAIEKLGATFEGIMRRHKVLRNGTTRDTALYSILDYEWPTVRAGLEFRLGR